VEAHAPLDSVLESLTGDIVIMGGYRGSVLRSSQPPYRQLWVPVKVGLNIRKVNLEVGLDTEDEETMEQHIFASGMLQNIGPVDISKRLFKKLRECENARQGKLRVHDYGYDWRLSPHLLSRKLVEFLEKLPSNQPDVPPEKRGALVIAHSLGGIITRHAVNRRPELFSGVLYAGTPQRCINILGPVRNGDAVLLNEKVLTAQVNFSLRTTFVFLPEDGFCFVDKHTGKEYPIDFYSVDDWIKYRLSPCVSEPALPPLLPKTSTTFAPLRSLSGSFSNLPLRGRSNSDTKKPPTSTQQPLSDAIRKAEITKDRTLAPQILSSSSNQDDAAAASPKTKTRNIAYLARVLAETKRFRAELAHDPAHQLSNRYPPIAVLYGKDIPTVYAARVSGGRDAIPCADAYDDLAFHSGDGVVLAREAMPPAGYEIARGGRVSCDRGHITLLGDLAAVGRALEAVVRGRRKGIGLGDGGGGKVL
jgi:pimeloyl-ACP methyl ester carboxylesterase